MPDEFINSFGRQEKTFSRGTVNRGGVVSFLRENEYLTDAGAKSVNALYSLCSAHSKNHANDNDEKREEAFSAAIPLLCYILIEFGDIMKSL